MTAVDAHVHIWPRGLLHASQRGDGPLAATPPDLLRVLDANGIDRAIVLPASIHEVNGYVFRAAGASGGRLLAIGVVDPWAPHAVASVVECASEGGVGVRIKPSTLARGFASDRVPLAEVVDAAADLKLAIQWTVPLSGTSPVEFAGARRPELAQVLDHLGLPEEPGDPDSVARLRNLADIPALAVKLSGLYALSRIGYPYEDLWAWTEAAVTSFGAARTMWASDWPLSTELTPYSTQLALLDRLPFLDETTRQAIRAGTALKFFAGRAAPGATP